MMTGQRVFDQWTTCPRCGDAMPTDPRFTALSRFNSWVRVCAGCGTEEAMAQMTAVDARAAVHPISGVRPWIDQEVGARAAHPSTGPGRNPRSKPRARRFVVEAVDGQTVWVLHRFGCHCRGDRAVDFSRVYPVEAPNPDAAARTWIDGELAEMGYGPTDVGRGECCAVDE